MKLTDDDAKEAIADLVESRGWRLLWGQILPAELKKLSDRTYTSIRDGKHDAALACVSTHDGILSVAKCAYEALGDDLPEYLKALKRSS